jgi:hypothetical protein
MKIRSISLYALLLFLLMMRIISSCTPDSCIGETTSFLNAGFYKSGTNTANAPDSVTIFGIGKETNKLYSRAIKLTKVSLPLDASRDTCGFVIKINNITDTMRFVYSSYPHLISKECGITFFYSLDLVIVSGSIVDTVTIKNKNITTFNEENIRIFY